MIQLEFTVPEDAFQFESPPQFEHPGVITVTMFLMPVFFAVSGTNFIGPSPSNGVHLSIIGFASSLRNGLERLSPSNPGVVYFSSGGTIFLEKVGSNVRVSSTRRKEGVEVLHQEALDASRSFANQVCTVIESRVPEMKGHPYWNIWFPPSSNPPPLL